MRLKLIFYDISNNKTRLALSEGLERVGMTRVQRSVFIGKVRKNSLDRLLAKITPALEQDDRITALRLPPQVLKDAEVWGPYVGTDVLLDANHSMFL